jgi:hypothetical protein
LKGVNEMITVEVKRHDDKPKLDKGTGKVKIYIETYTIKNMPAKKWVKYLQDELTKISKRWKSIFSIKFSID